MNASKAPASSCASCILSKPVVHQQHGQSGDPAWVSHSAVSSRSNEMEHTLGYLLFERTSRGVEPTAFGRLLLKRSPVIFDE